MPETTEQIRERWKRESEARMAHQRAFLQKQRKSSNSEIMLLIVVFWFFLKGK